MMLRDYAKAMESIEGWFQLDAALLFWAYNELIAAEGITGDVLEIGVHHGRSAIVTASLRRNGELFHAVDLFDELQHQNQSGSGNGNRARFLKNMRMFHQESNLRVHTVASAALRPVDLGTGFSFCHIDGGHSAKETFQDLELGLNILLAGGLLAIDDYFNPAWPGVCEGCVQFMLSHTDALIPLAIGFNKVIFQKAPVKADLNRAFSTTFGCLPRISVELWGYPTFLFERTLRPYFDLDGSTSHQLVMKPSIPRATIDPLCDQLAASPSQSVTVPVLVVNEGTIPFEFGENPFALSYHVAASDGRMLRWDNERTPFIPALLPAEERVCSISVTAPRTTGHYKLEVDIVWENILWLHEQENQAPLVDLVVA